MINMQKMNKKQAGFTLIELVMVIVILGILSAFALPRFADLTGDARKASIAGLAGALKSAAAIAHSDQIAKNNSLGTSVSLDGTTVTMVNGYPTANADGASKAADIVAADYTGTTGAATGGAAIVYTITGYTPTVAGSCQVTYTAATVSGTDNTGPLTAGATVEIGRASCRERV